jgi:hypothetical protein
MSLEQWLRNGWLQKSEPTVPEIQQLLRLVDREISNAQAVGLDADGRFQHAYNAALQVCMIALRAPGYQVPKGGSPHKRVIDSLRYTLGANWSDTSDYLERCSRLRGQVTYEQTGLVSEDDANDLLNTAKQLRADVINWLKANHPALVPPNV